MSRFARICALSLAISSGESLWALCDHPGHYRVRFETTVTAAQNVLGLELAAGAPVVFEASVDPDAPLAPCRSRSLP